MESGHINDGHINDGHIKVDYIIGDREFFCSCDHKYVIGIMGLKGYVTVQSPVVTNKPRSLICDHKKLKFHGHLLCDQLLCDHRLWPISKT